MFLDFCVWLMYTWVTLNFSKICLWNCFILHCSDVHVFPACESANLLMLVFRCYFKVTNNFSYWKQQSWSHELSRVNLGGLHTQFSPLCWGKKPHLCSCCPFARNVCLQRGTELALSKCSRKKKILWPHSYLVMVKTKIRSQPHLNKYFFMKKRINVG